MYLNKLLEEKNISKYKLSKLSGVPQTTILDLCSGKTQLENCSVGNIYRITQVLNISIENLLERNRSSQFTLTRNGVTYPIDNWQSDEEVIEAFRKMLNSSLKQSSHKFLSHINGETNE